MKLNSKIMIYNRLLRIIIVHVVIMFPISDMEEFRCSIKFSFSKMMFYDRILALRKKNSKCGGYVVAGL